MEFFIEKLPVKISPCAIQEAVVEFRFESKLPREITVGVISNEFKDDYFKVERLPAVELPMFIRSNDPKFKFSPELRLKNHDFQVQVGPQTVSVICPKEYKGWSKYFERIKGAFGKISKLDIVRKPDRIGLRYIAFFEQVNIFKNINVKLELASNSLDEEQNILRSEFDYEGFKCITQIYNKVSIQAQEKRLGSSIDIDIIKKDDGTLLSKYEDHIQKAHKIQKKIFFSLLNNEFLQTLNPEYE